jgi:DNA-3-methyladenine glycosylase II|tara:strand:+ start:124 stop:741 length:618 start_codon:yes stop_codon:yes gene_type:complete
MQKNWSLKILNSFKKLSELDDDLKYIINKYNLPDSRKESNTFETLMRIIIGQQISRKAAESIYQKLKEKKITTYKNFLNTDDKYLKNLGLSFRKIIYIKDLAKNIYEKKIKLNEFKKSSSEVVYNSLIKIKGIGKWTINNYQLFVLEDCDAWPGGDLAVQEAIKSLKNLDVRPDENESNNIAEKWRPFRGSAALLLWHYYSKKND